MLQQIAYALPQLPGFDSLRPKTYAAWPVWNGSTTDEIKWPQVVKKAVIKWYHKARDWNARKEAMARYGGTLGSSAMRVLECLIFDFQDWNTGQLDPSYEGIAAKTGLGRTTVWNALRRLKERGIIHSQRRSAHHWQGTGNDRTFVLKQLRNAYMVLPPSQWRGIELPPEPQPPDPGTWGDHPPLPDVMTQAQEELQQGGSEKTALAILEQDDTDEVALAVARLFRTIGESEKKNRET
jgi:hypothetical protein